MKIRRLEAGGWLEDGGTGRRPLVLDSLNEHNLLRREPTFGFSQRVRKLLRMEGLAEFASHKGVQLYENKGEIFAPSEQECATVSKGKT